MTCVAPPTATSPEPAPKNSPLEDSAQSQQPLSWRLSWLIAAGLAAALVTTGYALHGKPLAEKTLIALAMPVGAVWLVTTGRLLHLLAAGRIGSSKMLLCLWLVLVGCGTRPLPEAVSRYLETRLPAVNPTAEAALDVAIVLGGGTDRGTWRAQAGGAGDRIVLAAELFHWGYARQLVTTGKATAGVSRTMSDPSDETVEIWTALGIPRAAIIKLGGRNTSEELAHIKEAWPQFAGKRVGLITSANHLPRAMRLARAQGLELIPIAADIKWKPANWRLLDFIPSAGGFASLASNQHELMAYLVNR